MSQHIGLFGGGRMIGPPLLQAAVERGWQVTVVNRQSPPPAGLDGVRHLAGDRGDADTLRRLADLRPDVIIDLSCYEPEHVEASLRALAGRTRHYIMMSTAAVYAPGAVLPWPESHPLGGDPLWGAYGRKKLENERIAARYAGNVAITTLRAPYVVGHPDFMNRLQFIADRINAGTTIFVADTGQAPIQLVSPVDVADALLHLSDVAPGDPGVVSAYNIGNSQFTSLIGLVQLLASQMDLAEPAVVPVKLTDVGLSNEPFSWTDLVFPFADRPYVLDDARLRSTGFEATFPLRALIADFVNRYVADDRPEPPDRYPAEKKALSVQPTLRGA